MVYIFNRKSIVIIQRVALQQNPHQFREGLSSRSGQQYKQSLSFYHRGFLIHFCNGNRHIAAFFLVPSFDTKPSGSIYLLHQISKSPLLFATILKNRPFSSFKPLNNDNQIIFKLWSLIRHPHTTTWLPDFIFSYESLRPKLRQ